MVIPPSSLSLHSSAAEATTTLKDRLIRTQPVIISTMTQIIISQHHHSPSSRSKVTLTADDDADIDHAAADIDAAAGMTPMMMMPTLMLPPMMLPLPTMLLRQWLYGTVICWVGRENRIHHQYCSVVIGPLERNRPCDGHHLYSGGQTLC